jgi:hypothetical protein
MKSGASMRAKRESQEPVVEVRVRGEVTVLSIELRGLDRDERAGARRSIETLAAVLWVRFGKGGAR